MQTVSDRELELDTRNVSKGQALRAALCSFCAYALIGHGSTNYTQACAHTHTHTRKHAHMHISHTRAVFTPVLLELDTTGD